MQRTTQCTVNRNEAGAHLPQRAVTASIEVRYRECGNCWWYVVGMFVSSEPLIFLLHWWQSAFLFVVMSSEPGKKVPLRCSISFIWRSGLTRGAGTKNSNFTLQQRVEEGETSRDTGGNFDIQIQTVRELLVVGDRCVRFF